MCPWQNCWGPITVHGLSQGQEELLALAIRIFFFKGEISSGSSSGLVAGHLGSSLTLLLASKLWTLGEWLCPGKPQFPSNRKTKVVTPTTQVWM